MKIRHLHYFLVVAEELSFSRAAARVHIEPSPLARAIKELEVELGAHLFNRVRGRIRLTWAGEVFREEARRMLTFMEGARTRVHAAERGYRGRLRIALTDGLAQPRLTQLLARCREEEPLTEVRIVEMTVKEMVNALGHDQIDVVRDDQSAFGKPGPAALRKRGTPRMGNLSSASLAVRLQVKCMNSPSALIPSLRPSRTYCSDGWALQRLTEHCLCTGIIERAWCT